MKRTASEMDGPAVHALDVDGRRRGTSSEPAVHHIPDGSNRLAAKITDTPIQSWRVVSLFAGCGGMDLGFLGGFPFGGRYYDKLPFRVIWANDINAAASRAYRRNLNHEIHVGDIAEAFDAMPRGTDVVTGGFPCQDVSINGAKQGEDGKRTVLYRYMIKAIHRTKPRIFVAENVKGLLQSHGRRFFDRMIADFEATGYRINHRLYLAADYGVPQVRERLFIIGVRGKGAFKHPRPDLRHMTAREALHDLEDVPADADTQHIWSKAARSPEQGDRRLSADKPATTIRAEHHGNVQWHYSRDRRLSLREAARLQSFPDGFQFHAGMRETERMIGNAVPPVLAWHIANAVREYLDTRRV